MYLAKFAQINCSSFHSFIQKVHLSKVLIANRGEIACRIARSAEKLGIIPVTVYNSADKNGLHLKMSRETYFLEGKDAKDTYLSIEKLIEIAKKCGADCLHPGYGYLSESADLAEACRKNDIVWVGPSPETIRSIGVKSTAKRIMSDAGIPVLTGFHGSIDDISFLKEKAIEIGFPVLIKPVSGGGGKGIRVIKNKDEFESMIESSSREAKRSFVVDDILVEKFIENPRHIEIQIIGDHFGNILHLYERDCSLQRRHQKIIEEAPASCLTDEIRHKLGSTAVAVGKAVNYFNAGTVEFLFDKDMNFYFMEMNTRLQVEHPVTEMITNRDIVDMQFEVASGKKLNITQSDIKINGHALEARIYAEDPANNFLPCTGKLMELQFPTTTPTVRVDTGVEKGSEITQHFDPMIAKLIVKGSDRDAALTLLNHSLNKCYISGLPTNIPFLKKILANENFKNNKVDTSFIEINSEVLEIPQINPTNYDMAAVIIAKNLTKDQKAFVKYPFYRLNCNVVNQSTLKDIYGNTYDVQVEWIYDAANQQLVLTNGKENTRLAYTIKDDKITLSTTKDLSCTRTYKFTRRNNEIDLFTKEGIITMQLVDKTTGESNQADDNFEKIVKSPMNGAIIKINVKIGDNIKKGMQLVTIESMKMEHTLTAFCDGIIEKIYCAENDVVGKDKVLIEIA